MNTSKKSLIWKVPVDEFCELIRKSKSVSEALQYFKLKNIGANYKTLQSRCNAEGLDYVTLAERGKRISKHHCGSLAPLRPLSEIFIENSNYTRKGIKKRIILDKLLPQKCELCSCATVWNAKSLVLILDHKNGINNDNRIENLRFLCPNCNSQTKTFAGRNARIHPEELGTKFGNCKKCGKPCHNKSKQGLCRKCYNLSIRRVERPSEEILLKNIEEHGYVKTGKLYGVSDNAIRKWIIAE